MSERDKGFNNDASNDLMLLATKIHQGVSQAKAQKSPEEALKIAQGLKNISPKLEDLYEEVTTLFSKRVGGN